MGFGALNLSLLHTAQLHSVVAALGFRYEIDMLYSAFMEGDGPVGAIFAYAGEGA